MRIPDTHEAIIIHETFDKAQALLVRDTWTSPKGRKARPFSGFLQCAACGKSVTRSQSGKNIYYACSLQEPLPGGLAPVNPWNPFDRVFCPEYLQHGP